MEENKKDPIGAILVISLIVLLGITGIIYYRSIDWNILKRIEQTPLALPTPIPQSIKTATSSATPNP